MKHATRFASLVLLLTSLAAPPALAGDAFGLDLGVHGGVLNSHDGKTGLFVGGAQARLHLVWILAAEVRASTYSDSYDVSTLGGVDIRNTPVQVSAMFSLLKLPRLELHVLGGGTYNSLKLEGTGNVPGSVNSSKWAAHAGAGLDVRLSKSFLLNLDGRYVFLDVDPANLPPPSSGAYKGDYWTATAGLLWKIF
jgi:hypothetical protein